MKRDALIRKLRAYARKHELRFELDMVRGKGSHYVAYLDDRTTVIQSGELDRLQVKRICDQLAVDPASL
ncbi:hypothetical protein [Methylobacterium sp. JK268]